MAVRRFVEGMQHLTAGVDRATDGRRLLPSVQSWKAPIVLPEDIACISHRIRRAVCSNSARSGVQLRSKCRSQHWLRLSKYSTSLHSREMLVIKKRDDE